MNLDEVTTTSTMDHSSNSVQIYGSTVTVSDGEHRSVLLDSAGRVLCDATMQLENADITSSNPMPIVGTITTCGGVQTGATIPGTHEPLIMAGSTTGGTAGGEPRIPRVDNNGRQWVQVSGGISALQPNGNTTTFVNNAGLLQTRALTSTDVVTFSNDAITVCGGLQTGTTIPGTHEPIIMAGSTTGGTAGGSPRIPRVDNNGRQWVQVSGGTIAIGSGSVTLGEAGDVNIGNVAFTNDAITVCGGLQTSATILGTHEPLIMAGSNTGGTAGGSPRIPRVDNNGHQWVNVSMNYGLCDTSIYPANGNTHIVTGLSDSVLTGVYIHNVSGNLLYTELLNGATSIMKVPVRAHSSETLNLNTPVFFTDLRVKVGSGFTVVDNGADDADQVVVTANYKVA